VRSAYFDGLDDCHTLGLVTSVEESDKFVPSDKTAVFGGKLLLNVVFRPFEAQLVLVGGIEGSTVALILRERDTPAPNDSQEEEG
jgi:hypothetical protein